MKAINKLVVMPCTIYPATVLPLFPHALPGHLQRQIGILLISRLTGHHSHPGRAPQAGIVNKSSFTGDVGKKSPAVVFGIKAVDDKVRRIKRHIAILLPVRWPRRQLTQCIKRLRHIDRRNDIRFAFGHKKRTGIPVKMITPAAMLPLRFIALLRQEPVRQFHTLRQQIFITSTAIIFQHPKDKQGHPFRITAFRNTTQRAEVNRRSFMKLDPG